MSELKVIFMDAGQGDCTLVLFPDGQTNWLIDCGSIKNGQLVAQEILTVLKRELRPPSNKIDRLILTHPDQDHYNLLSHIVPVVSINEVVYGGQLADYKNQIDSDYTYKFLCDKHSRGKAFSPNKAFDWNPCNIGGAQVHFLAANAGVHQHGLNNDSIVLLIEYQNYRFFLMGDAEAYTENFIIGHPWQHLQLAPPANNLGVCLKLGHHGSESGTSENWVKKIKPTALVVSADTRSFGSDGRGMPALSKITHAMDWSGRVANLRFLHCYVVWCDDPNDQIYNRKHKQMGPTQRAICTTLDRLEYDPTYTSFKARGGSWHFQMQGNGELTELFVESTSV